MVCGRGGGGFNGKAKNDLRLMFQGHTEIGVPRQKTSGVCVCLDFTYLNQGASAVST